VTVPDLGPIEATYDLSERADRHLTTIRHRWVPAGNRAIGVETRHRLERDRLAALERLRLNLMSTSANEEEEVST
jgi:hypothetical protein